MTSPSRAELLSTFCVLLTVLAYAILGSRRARTPPGPVGYPFIGVTLGTFNAEPFRLLARWREQFGQLVATKIAGRRVMFVNGYHIADDLLNKRRAMFSDKPPRVMAYLTGYTDALIFMPQGNRYKRTRRQMHEGLNARAVHKHHALIVDSTARFLRELSGGADNLIQVIRFSYVRTLLQLTIGYDAVSEEDPMIVLSKEVGENATGMILSLNSKFWVEGFPFLRYLPIWAAGRTLARTIHTYRDTLDQLLARSRAFVKDNLVRASPYSDMRTEYSLKGDMQHDYNVASSFLAKLLDVSSSEEETRIAEFTSVSLYGGATDTIVSVTTSFFMAMLLRPDAQLKAQAEIDNLLKRKRLPQFSDRGSLPYIDAIVTEVLRWAPAIPLTSRLVSQDVPYQEYTIPSGTSVVASIWGMAHDPERFEDPDAFRPERFYDPAHGRDASFLEESKKQVRSIVFGFGRRVCPGMFLADDWFWLVLASVLATMKIAPPDGVPVEHPEFTLEAIIQLPPFPCSVTPRYPGVEQIISGGSHS
ncbi:cytochrome P450 [Earliella scabrosa]|nr:cytochrome P450 [Earliella scabrosa]